MSVAIRKLDGVESVEVSLESGTASVLLEPGNRLDPERIRQVARDNGFTPKGAEVRVAGRLVEAGGSLALAVNGLDHAYLLAALPEAEGRLAALEEVARGERVVVIGHLPERAAASEAGEPRTLQLRDFALEVR